MNRWCNIVQTPNSPTPQEDHRMPQTCTSEKCDNLDKYNKFINELSVRVEGGWPPADHIPHYEDLLRHTLGLPPRVKQNKKTYPVSVQDIKRNRLAPQPDSDKRTESDKESTSTATTKTELQSSERQQLSEDKELPFQQGLPLKEDNINSKTRGHMRRSRKKFKNSRPQS